MKALALLLVVQALPAAAQVDRYVVENDTAVSPATVSANPSQLRGQGPTSLIAITCAGNACTRAAPSNSSSPQEGILISGVGAYIVTLSLNSGTFSGTGAVEVWLYADDSGNGGPSAGWYYVAGKDIVPANGKSSVASTVQLASLRPGKYRLVVRANAVGTSAAAPVLTATVRACLARSCAP